MRKKSSPAQNNPEQEGKAEEDAGQRKPNPSTETTASAVAH